MINSSKLLSPRKMQPREVEIELLNWEELVDYVWNLFDRMMD
jgi:hypothetical protein